MSLSRIWVAIGMVLLTSGCRGELAHKRLPLGFQGMRGKKNIDFTTQDENFVPQNVESERVSYPSGSGLDELSRYENMHDPWALAGIQNNVYRQQSQVPSYKRAPMGFLGMRGKKENTMDAGRLYSLNEYLVPEYLEKRGLKGFQGMRGKKQYEYLRDSYFNKRKSMGFQGMRGKKDNVGEEPLNYYGDMGASPNDFKTYLMESEPSYEFFSPEREYLDATEFVDKRGLKGFQGMRGKREFENLNKLESNKRAPSGFQGMRGKKDDGGDQHTRPGDSNESETKPTTSQSAETDLGMREIPTNAVLPTANSNENISEMDNFGMTDLAGSNHLQGMISVKERRSPSYGFYGVRGKKMPSPSTFYGMRGKKGPFDFPLRGKFVGVRGKKSETMQHLAERLSWTGDDNFQKRRGPSGFVGMRGKKSITPDDEFEPIEDAEE